MIEKFVVSDAEAKTPRIVELAITQAASPDIVLAVIRGDADLLLLDVSALERSA